MNTRGLIAILWVGWSVSSCAAGDDTDTSETTAVDVCADPALTWEGFAQPFFSTWCTSCHGSDLVDDRRHGAPPTLNFDTLEGTLPYVALIQSAAVDSRRMPPTDAIAEADRERLGDWIACGTPGTDLAPPDLNFCDAPQFYEGSVVASNPPPGACVGWNAIAGTLTVDEPAPLLDCLCAVDGAVEVTAAGEVAFPELVTVGGNLLVEDAPAVTVLRAPFLRVVAGDLFVIDDPAIETLDLPRLVIVGGGLVVSEDPALVNVTTMAALDMVGGSLQFTNLDSLVYLGAAPEATAVDGRLHVIGNTRLEELWVAASITTSNLEIVITDNPALRSVVGLGDLAEAGALTFDNLPQLASLPLMGDLLRSGSVTIAGTSSLENLTGLDNLRFVEGSITIDANTALRDLTALRGIDSITGSLTVTNNPMLAQVEVDSLLDMIGPNISGGVVAFGNGP